MSKNVSRLSGRRGLQENLFEEVRQTDGNAGEIADRYLVGSSTITGSRSFYEFLHEEHTSKKAWVCSGTSCLCSGDQRRVKDDLEAVLGKGEVGTMTCLGHCYDADSFHFNGQNYSGGQSRNIEVLRKTEMASREYSVRCCSETSVLVNAEFASPDRLAAILSPLLDQSRTDILAAIKSSGLRGRGGAGFPAADKWDSCMQAPGDVKFIVCNADEGDPGAFSDRYLLEQQPLRVILGMMIAGWIVGAREGVVYIRAEYPESISVMSETITRLYDKGLLGRDILDRFDFDLKIIAGAGAYICGEETALIASIEGRRPEVDIRPPYPTLEGLYKKPTVLNNVETFAVIPHIVERGGEAYADLGSGNSTGTKLISLDAGFYQPGIVEVEMGTPLPHLIHDLAGGFRVPTKAVHIGGPLGGLVPVSEFDRLTVDFESFAQQGFLLGHASFVCIPESFPMINYLQHLFEFTRAESCGKCFPCRLGSVRGEEMFLQAISGEKLLGRTLLDDLLETLETGSLCALGGGLPLPVKNALQYFGEELRPYFDEHSSIPVRRLT
jgi:NADH:ubiquinone oxidoreductase subunit F (NADH-binding)